MAKAGSPAIDLRGEPDPGVIHLAGGRLVLAYDVAAQTLFEDASALLAPASVFYSEHLAEAPPVAIYFIPKGRALASAQR
jgi:hypothetical protein